MKVIETHLKGCFVIEPTVYKDERGTFMESFNHQKFEEALGAKVNFVQDNESVSKKGVVRALHMQKAPYSQAKLVRVVKGRVLDVAVDYRKDSPTFGQHFSIELSRENGKQLFIPRNFLHGFSTLEDDTIFNYKCDNYYQTGSELGVIFNDETLGIDWKLNESEIILSEKDRKLACLDKTISFFN
ncbi:dTDP-4-dehydrorhamnose 3,5-epimerase [Polaribacter septentrionalilitoris]|uniref:dTDP-4-dehydrorhamnose 3,5-epimerase n=1 Tax=Polaribacter septentrionalilitoris TaxID=2494657 RepID=UPI00135A291F|nr:dTDP-4-dehydrorhamnose 3,5-epimerase [Polaribacter septentrionalilitoris]